MFAYSERKGTLAARKLPADVKQRRLATIIEEQRKITSEIYASLVGQRERVLCESPARRTPAELLGRTDNYRPVIVSASQGAKVGDLIDVVIDRAGPGTLYSRPLCEDRAP